MPRGSPMPLSSRPIKRICVYCGTSAGRRDVYREITQELGRLMAAEGVGLVYGGAVVGLMGVLADAASAAGGEVIGIMPRSLLDREIGHPGITDLRVVGSMHERKALMAELSDAFIALPGGIGTYEELFEIWTWAQLGDHRKPCAILNAGGFYDGLLSFLDNAVREGFLSQAHRNMLLVDDEPRRLLASVRAYVAPQTAKWINAEEV